MSEREPWRAMPNPWKPWWVEPPPKYHEQHPPTEITPAQMEDWKRNRRFREDAKRQRGTR